MVMVFVLELEHQTFVLDLYIHAAGISNYVVLMQLGVCWRLNKERFL